MAERKTSPRLPLIISFVLFLGVVLGSFIVQLGAAQEGLDRWVGHEDHRLPNIRQVPKSCRWAVVDRFIDLQPVDKADAFIFGDSQMFARGATQEEIFYTHWLGADATIVNFAFLGAPISDMAKIADELHRRGISVPMTLQNVNLTHYVKRPGWDTMTANLPDLLPGRPKGISLIYRNRYVCAFRMRKEFSQNKLRTPRYRKLLTAFNKVKLPDYFVTFYDEGFYDIVPSHIENFGKISSKTIFVTAPMAYDKFDLYDFDVENLDKFASAFQKICGDHPKIECRDLGRSITSEGFMDLIHMNAVGHKLLGKTLKETLEFQD